MEGRLGDALRFDGTDDYVALGNPAELNVTGEITLSAWIKPEATDGIRNIHRRLWPIAAWMRLRRS